MAATDPPGGPPPTLHDGISELESLLADRPRPQEPAAIPVLDELAGAGDAPSAGRAADGAGIDPHALAEIARRLEQRLDLELAELAQAIKGVVKRCILEELRAPPAGARPAADRESAAPPEPGAHGTTPTRREPG